MLAVCVRGGESPVPGEVVDEVPVGESCSVVFLSLFVGFSF